MVRSRPRWATVALMLALLPLASGCGAAIPGLAGKPVIAACSLVTKADAERILGQPVAAAADAKDGECEYATADDSTRLSVLVETGEGTREVFEITRLPFSGSPAALMQDVAGLGERAYLVRIGGDPNSPGLAPVTILNVLKSSTMLSLIVGDPSSFEPAITGPGTGSLDALKAVAKRVIDQL